MGSEFFINSQELEDKIRQLLPSQGGAGAGFDLSASTQIIPIIDLTESAQGSNLREDLQLAISHTNATVFDSAGTTTTVITNTGYWRIIGTASSEPSATQPNSVTIILNDGTTDKIIWGLRVHASSTDVVTAVPFDFNVFLPAGASLKVSSNNATGKIIGSVRQIADIDGILVNPL